MSKAVGLIAISDDITVSNGNVSLATSELILPKLASDPANPVEGQLYYNTTDNQTYFYDDTEWISWGAERDPYWNDVKLYLRGGSTTDLKGINNVTASGTSLSVTPGKPFNLSESSSWYEINTGNKTGYLELDGSVSLFDPSEVTNMTIEWWLYSPHGRNNYGHFYDIGGQSGEGVIKYSSSNYHMYFYAGAEKINWGSTLFPGNTWHYFVFEKQGSTLTTWFNGTRIQQNTNTFPAGTSGSYLRLGYSSDTIEYVSHYFDELRVTHAARYNGVATIPIQDKSWPTR